MTDEDVLQGDDPTLIAIVCYIGDASEMPEVAPLMKPMRVKPLPWFETSNDVVPLRTSRWYVITYGFVDAA